VQRLVREAEELLSRRSAEVLRPVTHA
jgi:hypothetical protein